MFELGKFAYHYTTAAKAIEAIFPQSSLRMGSLSTLADPREAKTWPFRIYSRTPNSNHLFHPDLFVRAAQCVTHRSWVLCCTRDDPSVTVDHLDRTLRSGFGHPRMWAQYADNYKGVCIVLNLERLHEAIVAETEGARLYYGPVEYFDTTHGPADGGAYDLTYLEDFLEHGVEEELEAHISKHQRTLFFSKHLDWRDEWEYRWVLREERSAPPLIPIRDCVEAVLLGSDCSPSDSEQFARFGLSQGFSVHSTLWHGWSFSAFPYAGGSTDPREIISLEGIAFSTLIPCGGVFTQAFDGAHDMRVVIIENDGSVRPLTKVPDESLA